MLASYTNRIFYRALVAAVLIISSSLASAAELKPKTTAAFDRYVRATENRFANELKPDGPFLYVDKLDQETRSSAYQQLKQGEVLIEKLETKAPGASSDIPDGIVHHWVGLIF